MLEFRTIEEIEAWLHGRSREDAVVLASRMALRLVPAMAGIMDISDRRFRPSAKIVLPVLRAIAASWLVAAHPSAHAAAFPSAIAAGHGARAASRLAATSAVASDVAIRAEAIAIAAARTADAVFAAKGPSSVSTVFGEAAAAAISFAVSDRRTTIAAAVADADAIDRGVTPQALCCQPLWTAGEPPAWAVGGWAKLRRALVREQADWGVWIEWYQARLDGKTPSFDSVEFARVMLDEFFWKGGPESVNGELKRLIDLERRNSNDIEHVSNEGEGAPVSPPEIPPIHPAAVEPLWVAQQLILPRRALPADIDPQTIQAALRSLQRSLSVLADDAEHDTNVDRRAVRMLRLLAEAIPEEVPPQDVLFDLGHGLARLRDYQASVHEQWPDILAASYNAAVLQFDRTVRQFPRWREFIRNADRDRLTAEQVRSVKETAETLGAILDSDGVEVVVDPEIGKALVRFSSLLPSAVDIQQTNEIIDAATQEIALDLLESLDNVLKRLAERTVDGYSSIVALRPSLVPLLKRIWDSPTVVEARSNFDSAFKAQLSKAAKAAGKEAAEAVFYVPVCLLMFGVASALGVTGIGAAALTLAPVASRVQWCRDLMSWMKKSLGG